MLGSIFASSGPRALNRLTVRQVLGIFFICGVGFAQGIDPRQAEILGQPSAPASGQTGAEPRVPPSLFRVPEEGSFALTAEQEVQLAAIREEPAAAAVRCVEVNLDALKSSAVKLDLFGRSFMAWRLYTEKLDISGRSYSWRGALTCAEDFVSLQVEDNRIHGTVRTKELHLAIEPLDERIHAVIEIKAFPSKEHSPEFPSGAQSEPHTRDDRPPLQEPKQTPLFTQAEQQRPAPPGLFTTAHMRADRFSAPMQARLAAIEARKSTKRVHLLELNARALTPHRKALTLNLASDRSFIVLRTEVLGPEEPGGSYTWLGALVREPANSLQLVVNDGMCTARFRYGGEFFELRPLSGGEHALIRIETAKLPGEHPPEFPSGAQDEGVER